MLRREISKSMDDTMIKKTSHPKNDLNNNVSKDAEAYGEYTAMLDLKKTSNGISSRE